MKNTVKERITHTTNNDTQCLRERKLERMTITIATGNEISETEIPLLNDVVPGCVDFKGRPSVRSKSGCWKSAAIIIPVEVMERFSYYGISLNMVSYLTGRLGQSTASAASILNAFYGITALLPILGAFIADSFTGRFRMILIACGLYVVGLSSLTLSAALTRQNSSDCDLGNSNACSPNQKQLQLIFFLFSIYVVGLAQGGYSPCMQAFGADQFDVEDEDEKKSQSSFFNWWNCLGSLINLVPFLVLQYIQENVSWELGFGIPAIVMCFNAFLFLIGISTYRFHLYNDKRNPVGRIFRIFVKAAKNWWAAPISASIEQDSPQTSREDTQFKFLEKALLAPDGSIEDEKNNTSRDISDAKSILRLAPFWVSSLGYSIILAQPATLFTKQASTLNRHLTPSFEIPAASLQQCFITVSIMTGLPIYDRIIVPIARKFTKNPSGISMLQRITLGLLSSLISIIFAAFVEQKRLSIAREYGLVDNPTAMIPMSVWWLAPQYILSGIADVLAMVGLQEFFYDQVPDELKSVGLGLYASIIGIGNIISSFLVSAIQDATKRNGRGGWFADNLNQAHLDYFYWLLTAIATVGMILFVYSSRSYVYSRQRVLS